MKIILFTNKTKDPELTVTAAAEAVLRGIGAECVRYNGDKGVFDGAYAALSLGGDGTFLQCAKIAAPRNAAVLGIHLGHTGYLSRIHPDRLDELKRLPSFKARKRTVLEARLTTCRDGCLPPIHGNSAEEKFTAVNDFVFSRGMEVQTVSLEISVDGNPLGSFLGDGVIVSTAIGSTGYALSAGGPVADPELNALLVTPICAHTSRTHAFILSPGRTLSVSPSQTERRKIYISSDGGEPRRLEPGESAEIRVSDTTLLCLEPNENDFFENVRIHRL
jgi:NAD+ kinase